MPVFLVPVNSRCYLYGKKIKIFIYSLINFIRESLPLHIIAIHYRKCDVALCHSRGKDRNREEGSALKNEHPPEPFVSGLWECGWGAVLPHLTNTGVNENDAKHPSSASVPRVLLPARRRAQPRWATCQGRLGVGALPWPLTFGLAIGKVGHTQHNVRRTHPIGESRAKRGWQRPGKGGGGGV